MSDPAGPAAGGSAGEPGRGLRVLAGEEFSFADAIGGVRGLIESTLPGLVFVVVFLLSRDLLPSLVAAGALAVLAVVIRLVQRTPPTQAFSGLVGVGIGVAWAWWSGRAENFFAGGLIANVLYGVGALVSIVAGWPAVGVVVSLIRGEPMTWRTSTAPADVRMRRRYVWATWVFVALFALRLAVQVPLYLQGEEAVGWLGTAKLAMGIPLFAIGLWITWLLVGSPGARAERRDRPPTQPR